MGVQWSIPDDMVRWVFHKMQSDETLNIVFYDGKTRTPEDLLSLLKNPGNYPVFVFVNNQLRGLAWFNDLQDGHATAHFCVFKEAWGSLAKEMGKKVLNYWWSFPHPKGDGYLLDLLLGVTPSHYKLALRFVSRLGFKQIGEVPRILFNGHTKQKMNAILSYCERPT